MKKLSFLVFWAAAFTVCVYAADTSGSQTVRWNPSAQNDGIATDVTFNWEISTYLGIVSYKARVSYNIVGNQIYIDGEKYNISEIGSAFQSVRVMESSLFYGFTLYSQSYPLGTGSANYGTIGVFGQLDDTVGVENEKLQELYRTGTLRLNDFEVSQLLFENLSAVRRLVKAKKSNDDLFIRAVNAKNSGSYEEALRLLEQLERSDSRYPGLSREISEVKYALEKENSETQTATANTSSSSSESESESAYDVADSMNKQQEIIDNTNEELDSIAADAAAALGSSLDGPKVENIFADFQVMTNIGDFSGVGLQAGFGQGFVSKSGILLHFGFRMNFNITPFKTHIMYEDDYIGYTNMFNYDILGFFALGYKEYYDSFKYHILAQAQAGFRLIQPFSDDIPYRFDAPFRIGAEIGLFGVSFGLTYELFNMPVAGSKAEYWNSYFDENKINFSLGYRFFYD